MRLPDPFLDELLSRTPLPALVGRKVKLTRAGNTHKGLCPFHAERTPSFTVHDDHYHCFGCGAHGNAISYAMAIDKLGFREAIDRLAAQAGLEVPKPASATAAEQHQQSLQSLVEQATAYFERQLLSPAGAPARAFLAERGVTPETATRFRLGWAPRASFADLGLTPDQALAIGLAVPREGEAPQPLFFNRVMFPIFGTRGVVRGFSGRTLGDGKPKYLNGADTALLTKSAALYGIHAARAAVSNGQPLAVVEGQLDVVTAHQAGLTGTVAVLGSALNAARLAALWRLSSAPVICFDGDEAGRRASARAIETALPLIAHDRTLRFAKLPAGQDPDSLIRAGGPAMFREVLDHAAPFFDALYAAYDLGETSPEGRASLRIRLDEAAGRIPSRVLAAEYRRATRLRLYPPRQAPAAPAAPPALPEPLPARSDVMRWIDGVSAEIAQASAELAAHPERADAARRLFALITDREKMRRGEYLFPETEDDDQ